MNHVESHRKTATINRRNLFAVLGAFVIVLGCVLALASAKPQAATQEHSRIRCGTYDSRAVAVAYIRSAKHGQQMKDLMQQRAEAKKAGDAKRVDELNAQGESMQVRAHLQGFSTAPVDDVLDTVRDSLPGVAQRKNVVVITHAADYHDASVELVDVTDELVKLFNPDAQTQKVIEEVRKQKPVAIEVAAKMPASH